MAKQIEDIILRLKQEGFEKLDKIKGSFRELNKVTGFTETDISKLRGRLNDFAKEAGNTEAVNKGLIEAFKGLRSQVDVNGKSYGELTSEITRMESVLRGSTAAIDKQRAVLLEHARAGTQNAKSLQQQIDGLERLRQQTRPGSAAFLQLSKDIDQARVNLGRFKSEASAAAATLTQIPAASLEKIAAQIGRLQGQMQKLNISSDEFLRYQQRIALIGTVRTRTEGRQQVRALNAMFESEQYAQFAEGRAANLELPDTLAGIRLRISEINAELENITGYERRRALTVELKDLNRQLKNAIVDVVTQEDLALQRLRARVNAQREVNQASGFRAFSQQVGAGEFDPAITKSVRRGRQRLEEENERLRKAANEAFNLSNTPLLLPAAGQTSAAGTGDVISGGARRLVPGRTETTLGAPGERGAAQQGPLPSVAVGVQPAVAGRLAEQFDNLGKSVDRARRPLRDIYVDIDKTTRASNGSVNSLEAQIGAWTELRNAVGRTAPAFGTASKKLEQLTAQRERITGGRRLSGMQLAQGVGAALSGGIFGGPEGLIGGLGGLAVGGVGGAFAGAAFGAQVGMFRQQLGTVTDYSARIDKLQIALRGIVGSQDAYSQALAAAASVTRDLNIPQEVAIQGMTRLSAAVKGAGGTVSDSAFAFRAVSEAVKATGGNAEQADGALLALTQVFSKGKVSAEELNQIAERLPGTFTLFAKAAGMTGPQLQKALQEGQVGLNDLMKFLQLISTEYGQTALKIAKSSQEAGARLSVAMQDMQLAVGRALQPVGALLQDAFAAFIRSTTPALVLSAKLIGGGITNMYNAFASGINILVSLRGVFENLAKTMLVFGGITAGVFVASNITTFTNALKGALAVLRTLLSVEKALLVIENARIAAQAILAGLTTGATKGKILGAILGGAAGVGAVIGIGKLVEGVIGDIEKGLSGALKGLDLKLPTLSKFPTPSAGSDKAAKDAEKERKKAAEEALRQQTSLNRLLQEQLRLNYEAGAVDADALSKLDAEATLLKLITRLKIDEVTLSAKTRQEREQGIINLTAEFNAENKRIKKQRREILEEIAGLGDDIKKEWRELTGVFIDESPIDAGIRKFEEARIDFIERRDKEMKQLREKAGLRPEGAAKLGQIGGAKAAAEAITPGQIRAVVSRQILQDDIATLQADIRALESGANTMGTLGEIMERHRKYWQDLDEGQRQYIANLAEIKDSLRFMQDARIGVGLKEGAQAYVESIGTMREATAQLAQTGIKGVEDAIFSLVTTGTANFREFAASILKDTARMIIQQLILRSVMQLIGAIGGGSSGGFSFSGAGPVSGASVFGSTQAGFNPLAFSGIKLNALGNAYAANGIVPFAMGGTFQRNVTAYAMGGVVNQPTLFKFANGGAGRLGLMGEAGPEAIMPLRRLPNGRLGVEQAGGGAPVTVNVSVDATGTSVQGNAGQGEQLGRVISQAVQAELVRQQRPGGLLSR